MLLHRGSHDVPLSSSRVSVFTVLYLLIDVISNLNLKIKNF